jgi:hypothetical protein
MWPWGHLAFGYLLYSLSSRASFGEPPVGGPTLVLAVATQIPDLVDKPLSWSLRTFETGYGAAHSVFVAVPAVAAVVVLAHHVDRRQYGLAFAVGYGSHLLADVALAAVLSKPVVFGRVLWPVVDLPGYETRRGFVERFTSYFLAFASDVLSGEELFYVGLYVVLFGTVAALWIYDGWPVLREAKQWVVDREKARRRR